MYQPLPVGVDDFEKLVTTGYYFVDKTLLIKDLLDKKGEVNLFTRPRRFGKTLNVSMIRYFFEDRRDREGNKVADTPLFAGTNILACGTKYTQHMGAYPVINLTLKSVKQRNIKTTFAMLKRGISDEFRRHSFLLPTLALKEDQERFYSLMTEKAELESYCDALKFLSGCMYYYYGKKTIILIDEYDVPLESAYFNGYYEEMVDFIRSLFESALKTNLYLEFAVITGCLRISKESIFTGMNNLRIISILSKDYDEYFGFTEPEVQKLCEDYGIPEKYSAIKEWYDGYLFGNAHVYNPWSVILYLCDLMAYRSEFPMPYWANTSSNSVVRSMIDLADQDTKDEMERVIEGMAVEKPIHEDITYGEMEKSINNLWNFMFFTGYFRKEGERMDAGQRYMTLTIPNEEVRYIFRNKVLEWFDEQIKARDQSRLFTAFLELNTEVVQEEIEEMLQTTISFYDYYESFYHGFLAGILYGIDGYVVKSNREGGTGRTDLFIRPVSRRKTAYVVEFKVAGSYQELSEKAEDALKQIAERGYEKELNDDGYEKTVSYGIAFFGKNCEVRVKPNIDTNGR